MSSQGWCLQMSKVIPKEIREIIIIHKENGVPEETIAKWLVNQ